MNSTTQPCQWRLSYYTFLIASTSWMCSPKLRYIRMTVADNGLLFQEKLKTSLPNLRFPSHSFLWTQREICSLESLNSIFLSSPIGRSSHKSLYVNHLYGPVSRYWHIVLILVHFTCAIRLKFQNKVLQKLPSSESHTHILLLSEPARPLGNIDKC